MTDILYKDGKEAFASTNPQFVVSVKQKKDNRKTQRAVTTSNHQSVKSVIAPFLNTHQERFVASANRRNNERTT